MSDRDYENGDYWHMACRDCQHEFSGPKREFLCAICRPVRDSKQPAPLAATHSEDGGEVLASERAFEAAMPGYKAMVGDAKASRVAGRRIEQPSNMFKAWLECCAQHSRIVAAKDAEIARVQVVRDNYCALMTDANAQLRAQPARQVGGDEREQFEAWRLANFCGGEERLKKCSNAPEVYYYTAEQEAWKVWQARAALAPAAVVMPERLTFDPEDVTGKNECWVNSRNATLDEVARLNRRMIPVELLERVAKPGYTQAAKRELRALLGKGD